MHPNKEAYRTIPTLAQYRTRKSKTETVLQRKSKTETVLQRKSKTETML